MRSVQTVSEKALEIVFRCSLVRKVVRGASSACDCVDILEAFPAYEQSNEFSSATCNLSAVVAEIRLTV